MDPMENATLLAALRARFADAEGYDVVERIMSKCALERKTIPSGQVLLARIELENQAFATIQPALLDLLGLGCSRFEDVSNKDLRRF
jgi:hypothetical protein